MSRFFLNCLFLTFFFLFLVQEVKPNINVPKAFESGLVSTEYVDSKVLFITSSDGKIYAYDMEKHSLKWMIETDMTLQQWTYNSHFKLDELDFMVMPDYNGKMQAYSPSEGFQELEKADLEQTLHTCFSPGRIKYFSKVQESFLVIDLNKGMFWKLEDAFENIDSSRLDAYGVLKIRQYRYNAIDFQNMKEIWSLKTSDLDFYTYFQFLNHGNIPNPSKLLQNYKILCKGGNTIEVLRARDETFLRSIETESEVISVHSLDPNTSGFFSLKIESVGTMASSQETEFTETQLMVYNQIPPRRESSSSSDSHELAVFDGGRYRKESGMSYDFSTSKEIQIKQNPISIFSCIKEEISKKHAIQLLNTTRLLENGTINLVIYDDNEDKSANYNNPYVLAGTLGCMGLTAILSLLIERRRNKKLKKSVSISTETETKTSGVPVDETGSTGGSSSSRTKEMRAKAGDEVLKERKKKNKKREFEVFTKEILGLGSHGTMVFLGEFQGKSVAVKRFLKCYLEMARMEIDLLMATEHPNIIRYYLYEEDNEFIYLILERCLCSMRNFIDHFKKGDKNEVDVVSSTKDIVNYKQAIRRAYREKVITPDAVRKFALDIAKGLQYLHRLGIIHRDIKPENILLSLNLDAKLADFGISRILKPEEENFLTEAGSSGWKAPEMLKKTDLKSKPVDIFSLGCTFYYLHTKGEHPFGERHERDANILANRPQMKYLEDMALEHLIRCMIKSNPEERYTIDDVLNHPYFWEEGKKLAFIQEVSDFVESTDPRLGRMLEDYCQKKEAIPTPWNKVLDQSLVRDLTSFRFYDFKSVKELLRVIRNKKNHYYELSEDTKEVLGKMPVGVWNYFNDRFPRLFMNVFIFCKEQNVELSHLL